jgi:cystathionine beta-lyase/cystathionine gamma-synthase
MTTKKPRKMATRTVRAGLESDTQFGAVVPPIYLSSNFAFEGYRKRAASTITRARAIRRAISSPAALADLEGGVGAVVTCTGMAAITLILATLPAARASSHPHDCYGGTFRLLTGLHAQGKLRRRFRRSGRCGRTAARARSSRSSSGSRRRAIRCCASSISARSRLPRMRSALWSSPTTRFCRRTGSSR